MSIDTVTGDLLNFIYEKLNNESTVFLDLLEVFDTLNPEILAIKLSKLDFRNLILNCLKSYMEYRSLHGVPPLRFCFHNNVC